MRQESIPNSATGYPVNLEVIMPPEFKIASKTPIIGSVSSSDP